MHCGDRFTVLSANMELHDGMAQQCGGLPDIHLFTSFIPLKP